MADDRDRDIKGEARNDRLGIVRKTREEVLRKQLMEEAKTKCKDKFIEFGKCAEKEGLFVLFNCREQNLLSKKICFDAA